LSGSGSPVIGMVDLARPGCHGAVRGDPFPRCTSTSSPTLSSPTGLDLAVRALAVGCETRLVSSRSLIQFSGEKVMATVSGDCVSVSPSPSILPIMTMPGLGMDSPFW
jgi:hypothetical protein